jgi:hypothetical protein
MLRMELPEQVRRYLESDPFTDIAGTYDPSKQTFDPGEPWDQARCQQYVDKMDAISEHLKRWFMASGPTCRVFVGTCEKHQLNLRFCITSAGQLFSADKDTVKLRPRPHRIVDPVIMALQMTAGHFSEIARLKEFLQDWNLLGKPGERYQPKTTNDSVRSRKAPFSS